MSTIHVGNLSFNLGEKDLEDYFSKYGKIVDTYIVRRGGRPRGYGFVEFSSSKEADNALSANGEEMNGRVINIELAKGKIVKSNFQNDDDDGPRQQNNDLGGRNNNNGGYRNNNNGGYRQNNYGGYRNNNNGGFRNYGGRRNSDEPRQPRVIVRGGKNFYTLRSSGRSNNSWNYRREKKPDSEKEKSLTSVYVSNLPFSYDEKELANLFSDFKVKTAHIVTRGGRSKGFGFVEFESEGDQDAAVKTKDQTIVQGSDGTERTISVKASLVDKQSSENETTGNVNANGNGW